MNKLCFFFLVGILSGQWLYAQIGSTYVNPDFSTLANEHQTLAILPFDAIVKLRPKQMEQFTPEEFAKLQEDEGFAIQSALYGFFIRRKANGSFDIDFQDVSRTNALLTQHEITPANIKSYTKEELAKVLGVDAVVGGTLVTDKPMSEAASAVLGLLVGFYGTTNSGKCTVNIHDGETGELLFRYEKALARSLGSDTNTVINAMMRKASRKIPYLVQ